MAILSDSSSSLIQHQDSHLSSTALGTPPPSDNSSSSATSSVVATTGSLAENSFGAPAGDDNQNSRPALSNSTKASRGHCRYNRRRRDWVNHRESHASQQPFFSPLSGPQPPPVAVQPFAASMFYPQPVVYHYTASGFDPYFNTPMPTFPISSTYFPMQDPELPSKIVKQVDYYFSRDNLVKDTWLRQRMDGEGWVCIGVIAGFPRMKQLTNDIELILYILQSSNVVEVEGSKVRRRGDWSKWLLPPHYKCPEAEN